MQNSSSFFQGQARFRNGFYALYSSPFGVELKGRNLKKNNAKNYRYSFNGMEADDQVKGDGNSYTTEYRINDPRLGRWLSVDPEAEQMPDESTYTSMGNNPVVWNDKEGDCPWCGLIDYVSQVAGNIYAQRNSKKPFNWGDAFYKDVDFVSVAGAMIPGGKFLLKALKGTVDLYTLTHETTVNKGISRKTSSEILTTIAIKKGTKHGAKYILRKTKIGKKIAGIEGRIRASDRQIMINQRRLSQSRGNNRGVRRERNRMREANASNEERIKEMKEKLEVLNETSQRKSVEEGIEQVSELGVKVSKPVTYGEKKFVETERIDDDHYRAKYEEEPPDGSKRVSFGKTREVSKF
jgi:RHS repeat-associated protein